METKNAPHPETPVIIEGTVIEPLGPLTGQSATPPTFEGQAPGPATLDADEVRQRLTAPGSGQNMRGDFVITSAPGRIQAQRERLTQNVKRNLAVQAVAKVAQNRRSSKVNQELFNDFAPRTFQGRMRRVKERIGDLRDRVRNRY